MYYLGSRYYNPEMCRFLNADGYVSTGQGLLGNNIFAYCANNPVAFVDSTGHFAESILNPQWLSMYESVSSMGPVGFLLGLSVLFVGAIASSPSGQTYTDAVPAPAPVPAIPTPKTKTDTKENCTPTVKAIAPQRPNSIVFPANPYDFNPMGLTTIPRSGTKNGAMLQWVMWGRPNKKVFVWDEDLQKGSHYHK